MVTDVDVIRQINALEKRDYTSVKKLLLKINTTIYDSSRVKNFIPQRESALSYFKDKIFNFFESPILERNVFYGIVLKVESKASPPVVYVDLPIYDFEDIKHFDNLLRGDDLTDLSGRAFYAADGMSFLRSVPNAGHIAMVTLDPARNKESLENRFLGTISMGAQIPIQSMPSETPSSGKENTRLNSSYAISTLEYNNLPIGAESYPVDLPIAGQNYLTSIVSQLRELSDRKRPHIALDLRAKIGTELICPVNAREVQAFRTPDDGSGNMIKIFPRDHDFFYINLMHLSEFNEALFKNGSMVANVDKGTLLGKTGNTGATGTGKPLAPHLHMEFKTSQKKPLNPLYIARGNLQVDSPNLVKIYGTSIDLPLTKASAGSLKAYAESQSGPRIPEPPGLPKYPASDKRAAASPPATRPKMKLVEVDIDFSNAANATFKMGASSILVREDLYSDILEIKNILNTHGIPFSCERIYPSLTDVNLTLFGKVGLEIRFNKHSTLQPGLNELAYDYYIGPDNSNKEYSVVYGLVKKNAIDDSNKYIETPGLKEVYNIRGVYKTKPPNVEKINKPLLNITKIMKDYGFLPVPQGIDFKKYSKVEDSNWFIFYKPARIEVGTTYFDVLKTIYDRKEEQIWYDKNYIWDGKRFV